MILTGSKRDIILAAFCLWQASSWHDPELVDIAANGSEHEPLTDRAIDQLCMKLNVQQN